MEDASSAKAAARIVRLLGEGPAEVEAAAVSGTILLKSGTRAIAVETTVLGRLASDGAIVRDGHKVALSAAGMATAKRHGAADDPFQNQHRELEEIAGAADAHAATMAINAAESPLALLLRHRTKDGRAFLSRGEFGAGERLRADYSRGRIMPRMGANWEASVSSGRRGDGGLADLTDAALAARQRVDRALGAVGPELSGVLVDVCCFLKGLELVERERGWPVRSAKIVLKTALGVLSRHYDPQPSGHAPAHRLHWGAEGYRPSIAPDGAIAGAS
jgi:hypothetical protein